MWLKCKQLAAMTASIAALYASGAQAVPITYQGTLQSHGSAIDSANPDSGPFADATGWHFWQFNALFGQSVHVAVQRLVGALDPVMGVWFGTEADTNNYFGDMTSSSLFTTLVGFGDDQNAPHVVGSGGDPVVDFIALASGTYVIAVADHSSDPTAVIDLPYRITLAVPEPGSLALAGLALTALVLRKRRD